VRIAFVYDAVYPYTKGGVEKRIHSLSKELSSRGHYVHLFGIKFWKGSDTIKRGNMYLHGVRSPTTFYTSTGRRTIAGPISFSIALLSILVKEKRFDVIDCQNFPYFPVFSCRAASAIKGSKLFITWHELWGDYWHDYLEWPLGFIGEAMESLTLIFSPNLISVSKMTRRKLAERGKKEINLIANGIDYESLKKAKTLKNKFDVIFVGRLIKEKNVDMLVRAIAILKHKRPLIRCCIIGDGPESQKLRDLVLSLNLGGTIRFHKPFSSHENVFSYLKSSRVLALPSSREGFGMIAIEANACGIPILTVDSKYNAVKELVKDGVNGKIVTLSERTIAEGIEQLLNVKVKIKIDDYKWENIVKKLEAVYRA